MIVRTCWHVGHNLVGRLIVQRSILFRVNRAELIADDVTVHVMSSSTDSVSYHILDLRQEKVQEVKLLTSPY